MPSRRSRARITRRPSTTPRTIASSSSGTTGRPTTRSGDDVRMSLPAPQPSTTVVVRGASAGIGPEGARRGGERGYNLVLVARRREGLEELAGAARAGHGVAVDLDDTPVGVPDGR